MKKEQKSPALKFLRDFSPFKLFNRFVDWIKASDLPPKTHYKSMAIMTALMVFGLTFVTLWVATYLHIGYFSGSSTLWQLALMAFITLCPGIYAFVITIGSWRRIDGFEWTMIPFFD